MNLKDFFLLISQSQYIQGIEGKLRERRRTGTIATIGTILLGFIEIVRELSANSEAMLDYFSRVFEHVIYTLRYLPETIWFWITNQRDLITSYQIGSEILGFYIILLGLVIYYLNRKTAFLFKTSEEPFQYTFWINRFMRAEDRESNTNAITEDNSIHHLLHHDLMQMLNERIPRFSLLDEKNFQPDAESDRTPVAHIRVDGYYALRRDEEQKWFLQITPRVTIGPNSPSILTQPVEVYLVDEDKPGVASIQPNLADISTEIYDETREQVYSKVASEIYKQIKIDIMEKINLFPTRFLQATALYYEAEDFSRSNTLDAYEYAIDLYREAEKYIRSSSRFILAKLLKALDLESLDSEYLLLHTNIGIGYARSFFYRRTIAYFAGRSANDSPFSIPQDLNRSIEILLRLYGKLLGKKIASPATNASAQKKKQDLALYSFRKARRSIWRNPKKQQHLLRVRKTLFDAYVILSIIYSELGNQKQSEESLENARASSPDMCETDPLYLLAKALTRRDLASGLPYLNYSREIDPDFQIGQLLLARDMMYVFLQKGEINPQRSQVVIDEFKKVLKINPGNVAAYAQLGFMYWLIEDQPKAKKWFSQGIKVKSIAQQTYIGDLTYGLARIAAESGEFNQCFDLYTNSLSIEPGLGAYGTQSMARKPSSASFYAYITPALMQRYERMTANFKKQKKLNAAPGAVSRQIIGKAYGFVLNDRANARLNYFHRFGDQEQLRRARMDYRVSIRLHPQNGITYYNAANAESWLGKWDAYEYYAIEADKKLRVNLMDVIIQAAKENMKKQDHEIDELEKDINKLKNEIQKLRKGDIIKSNNTDKSASENRLHPEPGFPKSNLESMSDKGIARKDLERIKNRPGKINEVIRNVTPTEQSSSSTDRDVTPLYGAAQQKLLQADLADSAKPSRSMQEIESEITDKENQLKRFQDKLERLREEINSPIRRIFELSDTLTSITKGINIDISGSGVEDFAKMNISPETLNEWDIRILLAWADLLSSGPEKDKANSKIKLLCKYIGRFNNSFDLAYTYFKLLPNASTDDEKRLCKEKIHETIEGWIAADPIHYLTLSGWAVNNHNFLEFFATESHLCNALELLDNDQSVEYHNILADFYINDAMTSTSSGDGNVENSTYDHNNGVVNLEKAMSRYPNNGIYLLKLVGFLRNVGQLEEAKSRLCAAFDKKLIQKDDFESELKVITQAEIKPFEKAKDWSQAKFVYEQALVRCPGNRSFLNGIEKAIKAQSKQKRQNRYGESAAKYQMVITPIAVEVAASIVPIIVDESGNLKQEALDWIDQLRESIVAEFGVKIPSVRFRGNEGDLPNNSYIFMLNEIPLLMKTASDEDPLDDMLEDLKAFLKANLVEFLGHEEVLELIRSQIDEATAEHYASRPKFLSRLTAVLKALLSTGTSIKPIRSILEYIDTHPDEQSLSQLITDVRLLADVRVNLVHNRNLAEIWLLDSEIEAIFQQGIRMEDNQLLLALTPEDTQNVLAACRRFLKNQQGEAVIVADVSLRPLVQQLLVLEFPNVAVVAQDEIMSATGYWLKNTKLIHLN